MFNLLYTQHGQLARVMEASHVQTSRAKYGLPAPSFWAGVAVSPAVLTQMMITAAVCKRLSSILSAWHRS